MIPYVPQPLNKTFTEKNFKQLYMLLWSQAKDEAIIFPDSIDGFTIPRRDSYPSYYQYQKTAHKFAYVTLMTGDLITVDFDYTINGPMVTFTNTSTYHSANWSWDFGDGTTSNEVNPVHIYSANGSYSVTLSAEGLGHTNVVTINVQVDLEYSQDGPIVSFDTTSTWGAYLWYFGDGNTSTLKNPVHTYGSNGNYSVLLYVGGFPSTPVNINVGYVPSISYIQDGPFVHFSTNAELGVWNWNFGDGATSTDRSPVHMYEANGAYTVTMNSYGFTDSTSVTINVPLTFSYVQSGSQVAFTNTTPYNLQPWTWNFGDSTTSNEVNPIHTYLANDSYVVRLSAFDYTGTDTIIVNVEFLLEWTEFASGQTGFNIEQSYDGTSWTTLDTVGPDVTNYRVSNITHGIDVFVTNYFRVEAFNNEGSSFSNVAISTCSA